MIAQYAPGGQRQAWYTQSLARIDEVLNVVSDSGKQWYQADALGSVYGLTNQAGALIGSQNYDVFGAPTPAPSGPAGQPFGYTGREHELDSGLVYARDRYLAASVGAWTQADRLGFTAGPNFYGYANNQPTAFADPTGQVVPAMLVLAGVGAIVGATFSFVGGYLSGLTGLALLQHVAIGAGLGIASMLLPLSSVAALAIVNGAMNAITSLAQTVARKGWGNLALEDFISAALSGVVAAVASLLAGGAARAGMPLLYNEFFTHLNPGDAVIAAMSATATASGGLSDFVLQVLVIPAITEATQRMQIEAMFNEHYDAVAGACQ